MRADSVKEMVGTRGLEPLTSTASIERWARAHLEASSESRQERSSLFSPHFPLGPTRYRLMVLTGDSEVGR